MPQFLPKSANAKIIFSKDRFGKDRFGKDRFVKDRLFTAIGVFDHPPDKKRCRKVKISFGARQPLHCCCL
jgi:hypothetical protein